MSAMSCLVEIRENRISAVDKIPPLWFKLLSFNVRKNISSAAFVMRLRWEKFSDNSFVLLRGKKCINYPWRNEASLLWAFSFLAAKSLYEKIPMYKSYINAMQISSTVANLTVSRFSSPATAVTKTDRHGGSWGRSRTSPIEYSYIHYQFEQIILFCAMFSRKKKSVKWDFLFVNADFGNSRSKLCMYVRYSYKSSCEKAEAGNHASKTFVNTLFDETVQLFSENGNEMRSWRF